MESVNKIRERPLKIWGIQFLGIGIMLVAYYGDYTFIGKYPKFFFIIACCLTIFLLLTSSEVNGKPYYVG